MLQIGLTGGLASGKSTVASVLAGLGAVVIDADRLAREVVEPGTPGLGAVVAEFGSDVLLPDGGLDRPSLARLVFGDAAALGRLNGIVHPLVRTETENRLRQLPDDAVVVHDVPLIVENAMGAQYHLVVVVGASVATRTERAVARGLTREAATARIGAQADDAARRLAADVWIDNEGDELSLGAAVERLWRERLVPFADNLHARRPAAAGRSVSPPDGAAADRLIARLERAAQLSTRREGTGAVALVATSPDLPPHALLAAGLVKVGERRFESADPGCPAALRLVS